MGKSPTISIVSTVYNTQPFLEQAVRSILAQTFPDFELLLIDDGSSDDSGRICDALAAEDARIRVFHQANGGPASARNKGLDNARGRYIGFVDSDDVIEPTMYEVLYRAVQAPGVRLAACSGDCIDEAGRPLPGRRVEVRPGHADAYRATVLGIDEECRLLVRPDGQNATVALSRGEVRIVPEYTASES